MSAMVKRVALAVGRLLPVWPQRADILVIRRHVAKVPDSDVESFHCRRQTKRTRLFRVVSFAGADKPPRCPD